MRRVLRPVLADPVEGEEAALRYPEKDRWTVRVLVGHAVLVAAIAVYRVASADGLGLAAGLGVVLLAVVAAAVPIWHRPRAGSHRAWRVSAFVSLAAFSHLLHFVTEGAFGIAAHVVAVAVLASWYADRTLPWVAFAATALLHVAFAAVRPEWLGLARAGWTGVLARLTLLALGMALSSLVAESHRKSVRHAVLVTAERDRSDARHRQQQEASRAHEERLQTLVDALPQGVLTLDPRGRVTFANLSAARLLGTTRHALLQLACTDPAWPLRPRAESWSGGFPFAEVARGGRGVQAVACEVRPSEGPVRAVEASLVPLVDGRGRVRTIMVSMTDVTERERARLELDATRRQVAVNERSSALGSLISGVFHEIRTPLAYQQNHLYLAHQRLDRIARQHPPSAHAVEEVKDALDQVKEGVVRINQLVKSLRRFTRTPARGRTSLPLDEVVAEAVDLFRATHRGMTELVADLHRTPPCLVDRHRIHQVVLNLLENACEAAGPRGKVRVATRVTRGGCELEVGDTGPGIPPELRERVFDEFFTTKEEGTGLGLPIVRRIVSEHGGVVDVDSRPGLTRFVVRLPRADAVAVSGPPT